MVNFDQEAQQGRRPNQKSARPITDDGGGTGDEFEPMNPYHRPEKKRRLTPDQVQYLEKSFEVENKLEPERKVQLAKELGLQPRQVAIWFQNRRARYKTKQVEKDYDSLRDSFDQLKSDYDLLLKDRDNLKIQVKLLKEKLKQREVGQPNMDPDSPDIPPNPDHVPDVVPQMVAQKKPKLEAGGAQTTTVKQQEDAASSAKSDVYDSESPHCTDGTHSSLMLEDPDPAVPTARLVDPDQHSDFSQDEEEHFLMTKNLLLPLPPPQVSETYNKNNNNNNFSKVEDQGAAGCYDPSGSSCNFSLVDDQPFWSWLY